MKSLAQMMMLALAVLFALAGPAVAAAAGPARAEVRLTAYKVIPAAARSGARESLQPLKDVAPGDTVEYEAIYVNGSGQATRDVQLTVPVPAGGLELLPGQASPPPTSASVDGSKFEPLPVMRTVTLPDGRRVNREVPLSEYRALRWNLGEVPADASRSVRARMQLPAVTSSSLAPRQ